MIRYAVVGRLFGFFLAGMSALMVVPVAATFLLPDPGAEHLLLASAVTLAGGGALIAMWRNAPADLSRREALLLAVVAWVGLPAFGGLPFWLSGHYQSPIDAFFEAVSGFTTTGATVLTDVEVLQPAVQFWRCLTQWLGGMGIVLLAVAILPLIGHGGMQLYRSEFSGARSHRLKPRIAETALALWKIYVALSVVLVFVLLAAGMGPFDAICHSFTTMATGGFSTRTASAAAFGRTIQYVLALFMLLASISFLQHYRLFVERQPRSFFRDFEMLAFVALVLAAAAVVWGFLITTGGYDVERGLRGALFQVVSIVSTTGFATEDFETWHALPQVILLTLMFVGGCTGSTAGGIKVARIVLLGRVVAREFQRMVEQKAVIAVRLGGSVIEETAVQSLLNLVYLALLVNFVAVLLLAAGGSDIVTSISAVAASMFNVGPGLGAVGPLDHYGHLPALSKLVLAICMIAGRLEFYTLLVIFTPAFWRR